MKKRFRALSEFFKRPESGTVALLLSIAIWSSIQLFASEAKADCEDLQQTGNRFREQYRFDKIQLEFLTIRLDFVSHETDTKTRTTQIDKLRKEIQETDLDMEKRLAQMEAIEKSVSVECDRSEKLALLAPLVLVFLALWMGVSSIAWSTPFKLLRDKQE